MEPQQGPIESKETRPSTTSEGEELEALIPLVYDQLRRLARRMMQDERSGGTIDATGLVHEAYLRLSRDEPEGWTRRRFYLAAAQAMRRILVERARQRGSQKRGGDWSRLAFDESLLIESPSSMDILDLDEALLRLGEEDARACHIVLLRYFAGRSLEEAAETLGISRSTAKREWNFAKAWLLRAIRSTPQ